MKFADIIITSPETGRPALVADVQLAGDLGAATEQLLGYMRRLAAPLGIVIVGNTLRILRESYDAGADSIRIVGDFDITAVEPLTPTAQQSDFESRVQDWLEGLADPSAREHLPGRAMSTSSGHSSVRRATTDGCLPMKPPQPSKL